MRGLSESGVTRSTFRPRLSSRKNFNPMNESNVGPTANSTSRSRSLSGRASPRAVEPNKAIRYADAGTPAGDRRSPRWPPTSGTRCEVYRDLQVLERVGVPIYQERQGRRARWRVMEGYRRRLSITLSWPEMMALVAARKMLEGLSAAPLAEAAASAVTKVNEALPREVA